MKSKKDTSKTDKLPKTVKVSTLIKAAAIVAALAISFAAGVYSTHNYKEVVKSEARTLVSELKSSR